jgi:hypothetical protein
LVVQQVGFILTVMGIVLCVCGTIGAINVPKFLVIRSGVEISLTEQNKTSMNNSGGAKTSMNATSPTAKINAAAIAAKSQPPGSMSIGQSVPAALLKALERGRDAIAKVVTRQEQGFAVVVADFDACIADVDTLHTILKTYDKRTPSAVSPGGSAATASEGGNAVVSITSNPIVVAAGPKTSEAAGPSPGMMMSSMSRPGSSKVVPDGPH